MADLQMAEAHRMPHGRILAFDDYPGLPWQGIQPPERRALSADSRCLAQTESEVKKGQEVNWPKLSCEAGDARSACWSAVCSLGVTTGRAERSGVGRKGKRGADSNPRRLLRAWSTSV